MKATILDRLLAWDSHWSQALTALDRPSTRWIWFVIAHLGDGIIWLIVGALFYFLKPISRQAVLITTTSVLLGMFSSSVLKRLLRRTRPSRRSGLYDHRWDPYAFPSGHATRCAAIARTLSQLYPEITPWAYLFALSVSLSRVILGVHHLGDILGGFLVGTLCGECTLALS